MEHGAWNTGRGPRRRPRFGLFYRSPVVAPTDNLGMDSFTSAFKAFASVFLEVLAGLEEHVQGVLLFLLLALVVGDAVRDWRRSQLPNAPSKRRLPLGLW